MPSLETESETLASQSKEASNVGLDVHVDDPICKGDVQVTDSPRNVENILETDSPQNVESVLETNGDLEKPVPDPLLYQVETVDFPDSPQQTRRTLSKAIRDPLQMNSDDDSEPLESTAADISDNSNGLNSWINESLESNDEYFEDSLLHTSAAYRDSEILAWSSESDQSLHHSQPQSPTSKPLSNESLPTSNDMLSLQSNSDQAPDIDLLQKIKDCFDQEKIKDIYVLSGRLQDMLTPIEIQEIVINSDLYGDFIDDDMFEVLSAAYVELSSGFQRGGSIRDSRRKIRASLSHHVELADDIKIRAVFECHKNSNKDSLVRSQKTSIRAFPLPNSGNNMKQFFEDNLVKGATTLQNLSQSNSNTIFPNIEVIIPSSVHNDPEEIETNRNQDKMVDDYRNDLEPMSMYIVQPDSSSLMEGTAQDPKPDVSEDILAHHSKPSPRSTNGPERPGTLLQDGTLKKKKIKVTPGILDSEEHIRDEDVKSLSSISNKSDADMMSPVEDLATPDDIETPDEMDDSTMNGLGSCSEMIPELSAVEEFEEERSWKTCLVGGSEQKIDMKVIEPYKKVLSHGGYYGPNRHAIIVFSACNLPDKSRRDYDYVMDNLFFYVLSTLDQLVAEDYLLVYLHGATQRSNMPTFGWLKRCYQMIDRRLRKNLKGLYLVHPTFWLKTIVIMTKPFVSSKFSRKLQFVSTLKELSDLIPMDQVCIPDKVKQLEFKLMIEQRKIALKNRQKIYPEVYSTPRRPFTGYL